MSKELSDLRTLIEYTRNLELEVEQDEALLNEKKERLSAFKTDHVPGFMEDLGLEEFKLATGEVISVKTSYFGNISESRSVDAFRWMEQNGEAALIKTKISSTFGAGLEEQVDLLVLKQFLAEKDMEMDEKKGIHPSTLKAFIKRKLEAGDRFPLGLFGVHVAKEIVVE